MAILHVRRAENRGAHPGNSYRRRRPTPTPQAHRHSSRRTGVVRTVHTPRCGRRVRHAPSTAITRDTRCRAAQEGNRTTLHTTARGSPRTPQKCTSSSPRAKHRQRVANRSQGMYKTRPLQSPRRLPSRSRAGRDKRYTARVHLERSARARPPQQGQAENVSSMSDVHVPANLGPRRAVIRPLELGARKPGAVLAEATLVPPDELLQRMRRLAR